MYNIYDLMKPTGNWEKHFQELEDKSCNQTGRRVLHSNTLRADVSELK